MPLTDDHIQKLFAFIEKKRVLYYDLQLELVDHLAESIEEEMNKNPKISFEDALQKVYKTFGIFGFAKIVQEKEQAVIKANKKVWQSAVKQFFSIPKIIITSCVFAVAYTMWNYIPPPLHVWVLNAFWIILMIYYAFRFNKMRKIQKKELLLTRFPRAGIFPILLPFFLTMGPSDFPQLPFTIWVTVIFVTELAFIEVANLVNKSARHQYPEAFA